MADDIDDAAGEVMMKRRVLSDDVIPQLAERFKALAEPARLQLLQVLEEGEQTVNALVERTGLGQANVSKHLQMLHSNGFVRRRKSGLFVFYDLIDRQVLKVCAVLRDRLPDESLRARRVRG
jgi:DNA-binding transcriptional ArsR family regulator